jgi:hypothetical protein
MAENKLDIEKHRIANAKWRDKNRDKIKAYNQAYREQHPERIRAFNKEWRQNHAEAVRAYARRYYASPRGKYNILKSRARRNNARSAPVECSYEEFLEFITNTPMECHYCGVELKDGGKGFSPLEGITFDRKDNNKGYRIDNMVLSCRRCNIIKGSWFNEEQMLEIGNKYLREN